MARGRWNGWSKDNFSPSPKPCRNRNTSLIPTAGKFDGVRSFAEQVKRAACAQLRRFFNEIEGKTPPAERAKRRPVKGRHQGPTDPVPARFVRLRQQSAGDDHPPERARSSEWCSFILSCRPPENYTQSSYLIAMKCLPSPALRA